MADAIDQWALPATPTPHPQGPPAADPGIDRWALPASTAARVRDSLATALPTNPDQEAQLRRAATATGVPIQDAREQPDDIKTQAAVQSVDAQDLVQKFPNLGRFLAVPDNARLAHDDIPNAAAIEQHVQALGNPPAPGGAPGANIGPDTTPPSYRQRLTDWLRDLIGMEPAGRDEGGAARAFLDLEAKRQGVSRNDLREAMGGVSPVPQQFASGFMSSFTAGLAPDTAGAADTTSGQVASGAGTLAGFLTGLPLRIAAGAVEKAGGALLERTVGEAWIKGLGKDVSRQAATLGLAMGLSSAGQVLDTSTPGAAALTAAKATGTGAAMGGTFGAAGRLFPENTIAQLAARILGTNAALDAISGARPWDDRPLAQKVFDYGLNTFFSLNGAGRTGGGWLHDAARADAATADANVLGGLAQTAAASKLRERDPDLFKQYVASAAQDGPVPNFYVDGKVLAESLHQAGIGTDELAAKMPDLQPRLEEALATGGQVKIPVEDFATHIAGGPLEKSLLPHLRTDPEGMSKAEAETFYQTHVDELRAEAEKITAQRAADEPFVASQKQVQDKVLEQLGATRRFRPEVNQAYAAMTRDFYTAMSHRAGMLPHELFEKYPLTIDSARLAGDGLAQAEPHAKITGDEFGTAEASTAEMRQAARDWYEKNLRGTSVVNAESGREVRFGRPAKAFSVSADADKVRLFAALPDLIKNGTIVESKPPADPQRETNVRAYHYLEGDVLVGDRPVRAAVTLREDDKGNLYYNHQPVKEERTPTPPDRAVPRDAGGLSEGGEPLNQSVAPAADDLNLRVLGQGEAARGAFSPTTGTISLLKGADLSTFLHESGHFFLDTLAKMAGGADAPEGIRADMAAALKWMGHDGDAESWSAMTLDQQRAGHEQFARGFEAYLMEGKAPSLELRGLFSRFRSWLLNVYKSLTALKVELTPEVRGVFDRMLASQDAIDQAEQARAYMPLFDAPDKATMTAEEWTAYQALGAEATDKALTELQSKTIRDLAWSDRARSTALKDLAKDAAEKRKAVRRDVEAEVDQQPVYKAQRFFKRGELLDDQGQPGEAHDAHRLDIDGLKAMYHGGENAPDWQRLGYGKYGMLGEGGLHPDIAAELFGFPSGDAMVRSLLEAEPRRDVVRGLTEQAMLERHGEIATPEALARAADEAVHNDVRARFVATELKALNKALGPARDLAKAAKEVAESTIAGKRVRDISERQFLVAETKAGREAQKRLAAGDTAGAAIAKRDQLLNLALARAARDAQVDVDKGVRYLKRFDRDSVREKIDLEYREQIDALLDRFDLRKNVSGEALDKRQALLAFVERKAAEGFEPNIPEKLLDEARRQHFKDMPVEDFRGLLDGVKSIEHLGLLKNKLLDLAQERSIAELAKEVRETTAKLPQSSAESNRGLTRMGGAWLSVKAAGRSLEGSLLKMEQMIDALDARNPQGVLNRVVFRRLADAGTKENALLVKTKELIHEVTAAHLDKVVEEGPRIYTAERLIDGLTGKPQQFTKKEMLMLAGNMGNDSNVAKLTKGEGWTEENVWQFLNAHMGKADWDFVAGMGRALESLWPEKLAMSRRLGNSNPDKIQPRAFDTPHGRYDGWYWPMIYDPARAQDVAERGAKAGDALFENIYATPGTDTGRMNTRNAGYARPILLDLDALPRVIKDEIHDIAFREAVIDADRFLREPVVRRSIIEALSQQHYDQLRPWLQSIANDGKSSTESMRALKWFSDLSHGVRMRATMVGLGYRISTMLVHASTVGFESLAEAPVVFLSGLKDFANPGQWSANKDFVFERSGEMRNRMNEVDRDIREYLREIDVRMMDPATSAIQRGKDSLRAHAYQGIAMLDMASALPLWMGAYKKALRGAADGGLDMAEQDAIYYADKTVRNAHGGTGVKDMAAVQRGPEFFKLFTMFYTFWNHNVNRIIDTAKLATSSDARALAKAANNWSDTELAATVIMRTLIYTLGVQVLHSLWHPPKEGAEPESWAKWAAKEFTSAAFSGIPVARDVAAHYLSGRDYKDTPLAGLVKTFGDAGTDAAAAMQGKHPNDRWLKHALNAAGYTFALPLGQASSTAQFLWDVSDGKQHPQTAGDWWRGVTTGEAKKH